MASIDYFETGREQYLNKDYKAAAESFANGIVEQHSNACEGWLGQCYEYGLGVNKDLSIAKDLYKTCLDRLTCKEKKEKFGIWLTERLKCLENVPDCQDVSVYVEGIGNLRAVKSRESLNYPQFRYDMDKTVVRTHYRSCLIEGIEYAKKHLPEMNKKWTCDGKTRFYDGFTLNTDYFILIVRRGSGERYSISVDYAELTVLFPYNVNLDYIYVQESIKKKVKEVIFKRAQVVLPTVLKAVSERINVPYKECTVARSNAKYSAINYNRGELITFTAKCVMLPKKSLEALCVHELTHNFAGPHNKEFYDKMIELGGEETFKLDTNLWQERRWNYLDMN